MHAVDLAQSFENVKFDKILEGEQGWFLRREDDQLIGFFSPVCER